MGRLPASFAGRLITARAPWIMAGEIALINAQAGIQFPDATFLNSTDRPYEIHRMIPFVVAEDNNNVALNPQPSQDLLMSLIRMRVNDLAKQNLLTKSSTLLRLFIKGSAEATWEWADPYYLAKSEQLQVICDALTFPVNGAIANLNDLKVGVSFEGFFVTQGPASQSR